MKLKLDIGESIEFKGETYKVVKIDSDLIHIIAERQEDKELIRLPIDKVKTIDFNQEYRNLSLITDQEWEEAKRRFEIIKPLLELRSDRTVIIKEISQTHNVDRATIYRWLERYKRTEVLSSLVPIKNLGGKGVSRLNGNAESLLNSCINDYYLTSQKLSISRFYIELQLKFRAEGLKPPHINTVRNRIRSINEATLLKKTFGRKLSKEKYDPILGEYNHASHPLSIVQIDHTLLDIILVDEETRKPIGRPWITVAIDVYSRMIVGFYVSFDPPSSMSVGLCLSQSIISKESFLLKHDINGEWPCWGLMKVVHADNAKEFKGNMIKRTCEEYGIEIQWRPIGKPHWGGHIERLIGTLVKEIHALPGTTFSEPSKRINYNSEKKATFSLNELHKYLATFIVEVYHNRVHQSLGISPLLKYKEGILGSKRELGSGLPEKVVDQDKLKKDFMPYFERSIQKYGIKIDHITYYSDVLRRWINATEKGSSNKKKHFIFRRDPRDISLVYFLDPEQDRYYEIPCRNISRPAISIWEFRDSIIQLKNERIQNIDEDKIFEAYEKLNRIKEETHSKTKNVKRKRYTKEGRRNIHSRPSFTDNFDIEIDLPTNIEPFDDIDHGAS